MASEVEKRPTQQRYNSISNFTSEHQECLTLCLRIREGFRRKIDTDRIKAYSDWFWKGFLKNHFKQEEEFLFRILGNQNEFVRKALSGHRRLKRLFEEKTEITRALSLIEEELEKFIRFEERVLFPEIQKIMKDRENGVSTPNHHEDSRPEWHDEFWK